MHVRVSRDTNLTRTEPLVHVIFVLLTENILI